MIHKKICDIFFLFFFSYCFCFVPFDLKKDGIKGEMPKKNHPLDPVDGFIPNIFLHQQNYSLLQQWPSLQLY